MPVEISPLDASADFPELIRCCYESHETPYQSFFQAFCPYFPGTRDREASIAEATDRMRGWHIGDPTSFWLKAVDTDTGRIVGASNWKVCEKNPYEGDDGDEEIDWIPDGGARRCAEAFMELYDAPRMKVGRRPQVHLFILFTHPDYRRRGIGRRLLKWGMNKADEMGVDMFLDATPMGKPLYDKNGFQVVQHSVVAPKTDDSALAQDEAWKAANDAIGVSEWTLMWRPVRGEEGTARPWETEKRGV